MEDGCSGEMSPRVCAMLRSARLLWYLSQLSPHEAISGQLDGAESGVL